MFFESVYEGTVQRFVAPFLPSTSLFYVYVGTALVISTLTYFWFSYREAAHRPDGISKGLFGYIFDKEVWLHASARQDYVFFVFNALIYNGIVAHFLISSHVAFTVIEAGLVSTFGAQSTPIFESSALSALIYTLLVMMAADFAIFLTHYIQHKVAPLWHFHSVHHSAEVLTIITVFRQHPVDLFFSGTFIVILSQIAFAGFAYMTMVEPSEIMVLNVNVILFLFFLTGYNLRHSHIWLSYPPWLSYILISPAQHQTHHSIDPKHFDRNFGFIFAFWDWLFGTLYVPRGYEKLEFGINKEQPNPFDSVKDIYVLPFKRSWEDFWALGPAARAIFAITISTLLIVIVSAYFAR